MEVRLNLGELLLVIIGLVFGGMMLGVYFSTESSNILIIVGLMGLLSAGTIILRKRVRIK